MSRNEVRPLVVGKMEDRSVKLGRECAESRFVEKTLRQTTLRNERRSKELNQHTPGRYTLASQSHLSCSITAIAISSALGS